MAGTVPNVPGTGNTIPVTKYTAGITESFPNVNRYRLIETSINSKEKIDFMPVNVSVNDVLQDRYVEFRINGVSGSYIDLSNLVLEMTTSVSRGGAVLPDDAVISLCNGLSNTLFKSVTVFLNEKMVESNPFYNYTSYIKMLKSFKRSTLYNIGQCAFFNDDCNVNGVTSVYQDASFADGTVERSLMDGLKRHGVNTCFPLLLDISSIDMFLLDAVDVRIRLELASNDWLMNTVAADGNAFRVEKIKLLATRVTPHFNALTAFNKTLRARPLQYIFNKVLTKSFVIGQNQTSFVTDHPFGTCIPEKMSMVLMDMRNFSGTHNRNGLYFGHFDIRRVHITLNGNAIYNLSGNFNTDKVSSMYYESQVALGLNHENMLSKKSFSKGRTVFHFNFVTEDMDEALPVEKSASMRLALEFGTPTPHPVVLLLIADTVGIMTTDENRTVQCDVRG